MFGKSWDIFKKLALVVKHINDIKCVNPGAGHGSPSADAHARLHYFYPLQLIKIVRL